MDSVKKFKIVRNKELTCERYFPVLVKIEVEFLVVDVLPGGSEGCGQGDEHAVETQGAPHRGHEPPGSHRDTLPCGAELPVYGQSCGRKSRPAVM